MEASRTIVGIKNTLPLIVIVGPTGSGKTTTAIKLAHIISGEIICADSRTVYKSLDIGTAKPSISEREGIPHYLIDIVSPDEMFTVVDFKKLANYAIDNIRSSGKIPILVGGSGLYIDSIIYDYKFDQSEEGRDSINPRHSARLKAHDKAQMREDIIIVGINIDREALHDRLINRANYMIGRGLVEEVKQLTAKYPDSKALDSTVYKAFRSYISGEVDLETARKMFVQNDFQLARRQMSWFKRNKSIHWVNKQSEVVEFVTTILNKKQ